MGKREAKEESGTRPIGYRLKASEPDFQVTREGEFAFHTFRSGVLYERVPEEDRDRFEVIGGGEER